MPLDRRTNRGAFLNDAGSPVAPAADASQAALDRQWWAILLAGHVGTGVVTGGLVQSITGGRNVDVAAAQLQLNGAPIAIADTTFALGANTTAFRRFDLVLYRGSSGTLRVVQGVADRIPCFPAVEHDANGEVSDVVLGAVLCLPGFTDITLPDITQLGVPPASTSSDQGRPLEFELFRDPDTNVSSWANTCSMMGANTSANIQDNIVTDPATGDQFATFWNASAQPLLVAKGSYETWFTYYTDPAGPNQSDALAAVNAAQQSRWWHMPPHTARNNNGTLVTSGPGLNDGGTGKVTYDDVDRFGLGDPDYQAGHSFLSMGIDNHSRLHISGNEHGVPLSNAQTKYWQDWQGKKHAAIETIFAGTFIGGVNENTATYPRFFNANDGTLFFNYRNGSPAGGKAMFYRWDDAAATWSLLPLFASTGNNGLVIDGIYEGGGDGAHANGYPNHFSFDKDDNLHIFFVWREGSGSPVDNSGCYYFRLEGMLAGSGGARAFKANGAEITLPIQQNTQPSHAADRPVSIPIGPGSDPGSSPPYAGNLLNNGGACVDAFGNPHAAFQYHDTNRNQQIHHLWHDGTAWHVDTISNFRQSYTNNGGSAGDFIPYPRPAVVCDNRGKTYIVAAWRNERLPGAVWAWDVSPGVTDFSPFPILNIPDLGEITFDTLALRDHNVLRFLVLFGNKRWMNPGDGGRNGLLTTNATMETGDTISPAAGYSATVADPWGIAGVCTIDLAQMEKFRNREVVLPHIEVVASGSTSSLATISHSTAQAFGGLAGTSWQPVNVYAITVDAATSGANPFAPATAGRIAIGDFYRGRLLFCRQTVTMKSDGTWMSVGVRAVPTSYMNPWGQRLVDTNAPGDHNVDDDLVYAAVHAFDGQNDHATHSSHWCPLVNMLDPKQLNPNGYNNGNLGILEHVAKVGSTSSGDKGRIEASVFELGVLHGETNL